MFFFFYDLFGLRGERQREREREGTRRNRLELTEN